MNKVKVILASLLMVMVAITSCQDDDHELGAMLDPSQIDFDVTQDFTISPGGNTIILKNNTPGTVSMWDYGTGRSNRAQDTVQFAFKGEYTIKFSAMTAGGVVEMEPVVVTVEEDDFSIISDPFWTMLTGGVGQEKTWYWDFDANGVSKYFDGPLYFSGDDLTYGGECAVEGGNCWTWFPEWQNWMPAAGDYGSMTFSLDGGPFITVDQKIIPSSGVSNGTYFLDPAAKTITFTDVVPINGGWEQVYSTGYIISMTEDAMQLAFRHTTKDEYEILNYISKEYNDNWVPEEQPDPNFDHGDQAEILAVSTAKTWKLDLQVPYNWTNLEGDMLNNWNSRADIIATGWAPYGDGDVVNIDEASITFTEAGDVQVKQDNGTVETGTYSIDEETNMIMFDGVKPSILIASWVTATTTDDNKWKIVKVERDAVTDKAIGLWFGKRDPSKSEYMVFHFVLR